MTMLGDLPLHGQQTPYLSLEGKRAALTYWLEVRAQRDAMTEMPVGGRGYPDPEIYGLTDQLNAMLGVCTLQSCAGHIVMSADGSGECHYPGSLWLWLDHYTSDRFHERVYELAHHPLIEQVRTIHFYDERPKEVIDIVFAGRDRLHESAVVISEFFRSLVRKPVFQLTMADVRRAMREGAAK